MQTSIDEVIVSPSRVPAIAVRRKEDLQKLACAFALRKVDDALALIGIAYTRHEGIYGACLQCLFGLDDLEELPSTAKSLIAPFLSVLQQESGVDTADQAQTIVSSLTASQALQFVDDLINLRLHLEYVHYSLCEATQ